MNPRPETVAVIPSPRRLVESLRDVGYDFVSAVADLIDNSIAANATTVDVTVHWDGPDSWVRVGDNGTGMDAATITEALRFGSERSYRPDDLGKFGLGLKTASLSQCRRILVASRMSDRIARLEARRFDLDRILVDDRWEVEVLAGADRPSELVAPLSDHPGTVVVWTQLDRVLGTRVPHGERARAALVDMTARLETHLAMVFHRFLEGDIAGRRRRPLAITINGTNVVRPWNPFAADEPHTQHLQVRDIDIATGGVSGVVTFDPWVLPARKNFSSEARFSDLSGPAKWAQQQGFYIYRANRMIQSGGWSRMRTVDEHTKLARVALDFYPELDTAFGINIAKMRVSLPAQLRERLRAPVEDLIRVAKRSYDPRGDRDPAPAATRRPAPAALMPAAKAKPAAATASATATTGLGGLPVADRAADPTGLPWPPPPLPIRQRPGVCLTEAAAATGDTEALGRIRAQLEQQHPEVARDLGW